MVSLSARRIFCVFFIFNNMVNRLHSPVLRFAPSPNGRLHLGHAYSALLNNQLAVKLSGTLLLRMEDIDTTRCTDEFANHCLEDLRWLGLRWQEPVRIQSQHFDDYKNTMERLRDVVYPCFCSRSDIARATPNGKDPDGATLYPGTCKYLSPDTRDQRILSNMAHSWRLDMQKALTLAPGPHAYKRFDPISMETTHIPAVPSRWGDVILARKETPTSYHLSVVVDDALQQVTHIVRGADLEAATDLHVLLQSLLGLPTPLYHHHGLITQTSGDKLSKSKGSQTLADLRAQGVTAQEIRHMLGF